MCGIVGTFDSRERRPVSRALLERMNDTQIHRGPDGDGIFVAPGIGLGHRRLAIIDLSGGAQPLFNEDESVVVVYNGEIYNFAGLADELPWHDVGASPVDLLLEVRRRGFGAAVARGSWEALVDHLEEREPVLVMFDAGVEVRMLAMRIPSTKVMHWGVVSGMALDGSELLLAARDHRHYVVDRADFLRRWSKSDNCMIVIRRAIRSGTPK